MPITHNKEEKQRAKDEGLFLISIEVPGMSFQGPVDEEERDTLTRYLLDFLARRRAKAAATKTT